MLGKFSNIMAFAAAAAIAFGGMTSADAATIDSTAAKWRAPAY